MRAVLLVLCFSTIASAQTLVNPTRVEWESADHAVVTRYDLGYYTSATASEPAVVVDAGKPATCAPCSVTLQGKPLLGGNLVVRVRAIGPDGQMSAWSTPSNPFDSTLVAPTTVVVAP